METRANEGDSNNDGDGSDDGRDDDDNDQSPGPSSATAPTRMQTRSKAGRISTRTFKSKEIIESDEEYEEED